MNLVTKGGIKLLFLSVTADTAQVLDSKCFCAKIKFEKINDRVLKQQYIEITM